MPNYKLTYFTARGLAECSRLTLHYAGQDFEDVRLEYKQFLELKESFPNRQVPLLEVDGHKISQSGAILRYLGRKFHLEGKDEFETARADEVYNFFYDQDRAQIPHILSLLGLSNDDKDKLHKEVFLPVANKSLEYYDKLLRESRSGFVLESGVSYADFVIAEHLNTIFQCDSSLKAKNPFLVKYQESIYSLPQLVKYIQNRPQSVV